MGIKGLNKFLEDNLTNPLCIQEINTTTLRDKAIVIDASITLYQFITAIKNSSIELYNTEGKPITHIKAIINKCTSLLKRGIKPIFIFDGAPPEEKMNLLNERSSAKAEARDIINKLSDKLLKIFNEIQKIKLNIEKHDILINHNKHVELFKEFKIVMKELESMHKRAVHIADTQTTECMELLNLMGIPCIQANSEADPQCAYLTKATGRGDAIAYAVSSEDMDILTFGAKKFIRKLSAKNTCIIYDIDLILTDLNVTYNQFIDICILLGCDYTSTIYGLGPKRILPMIKEYGSIEGIIRSKLFKIPDDFDYNKARNMFKNPDIIENVDIKWNIPKYDELDYFLRTTHKLPASDVDQIINHLHFGPYSLICGEHTKQSLQARRLQNISMDSDSD